MKRLFKVLLPLVLLTSLAACSQRSTPAEVNDEVASAVQSESAFRILAGSELKDVAQKVQAFGRSQGIEVQLDYSGSLDAVDKLAEPNSYDAVWLSHGKYLQLMPQMKALVKASEKTMYSRVVLGVKPDKMKELGWASGKTSWTDVVKAVKAGSFHFAMTNPAGSNTGFVALVGLASELSGKGDALEAQDIPSEALKKLFSGQIMTSGSSGALADKFVADAAGVDGMVNYESVIRSVSRSVPLEVLIPKEGVITADYPLMLLTQSKNQKFYDSLVAYLRSEAVQQEIARETFRTPLAGSGTDEVVNELPFPGSLKVVDAVLRGFMDSYSRPVSSFFVLDVSGSMEGERLSDMKRAMVTLSQGDGSVSGRFATFRNREKVVLTSFASQVSQPQAFSLTQDTDTNKAAMQQFSAAITGLQADGGTAIYDALLSVYDAAQDDLKSGDRTVSIVLFSDGDSNQGRDLDAFLAHVQSKGAPAVPVHAILYGESNVREMDVLTKATGGRVFDARATSLRQVMKSIRAYQ